MHRRRWLTAAGLAAVAALLVGVYVVGWGDHSTPLPRVKPAKRVTGWLHTSGARMVGPNGPVRLVGLDEPGLVSGAGNNRAVAPDACDDGYLPVASSEYANFQRFGFNSVRLGISWANMEPTQPSAPGRHEWNAEYLQAVDDAVKGFTSRGIAVVLDMHANNLSPAFKNPKPDRCQGSGLPTWLFPDPEATTPQKAECTFLKGEPLPGAPVDAQAGYADAWHEIASRYASNQLVVGADIFNEPSSARCPGLDLLPFYEQMGNAIRSANPHLLLIYQDNAARKGNFALNEPLDLPNSVYSFHFYPVSWSQGEPLLQSHVDHVAAWHQPIWLGEFGVFREQGRGAEATAGWVADLGAMMHYCRVHNIGWAFHQYSGGAGSLIDRQKRQVHTDWLAGLEAGF